MQQGRGARENARNQANANLLVEHFKYLLTCTAFQQLAVNLETFNCLLTGERRLELHCAVLRRVVLAWFSQGCDNMINLEAEEFISSTQSSNLNSETGSGRRRWGQWHEPGSSKPRFRRSSPPRLSHPTSFRIVSSPSPQHSGNLSCQYAAPTDEQ